jgi:NodT family efflux transporter outer membrane factor (OMF) lipoprotein
MIRPALLLASSLSLAACATVGPDYRDALPDVAASQGTLHASADPAFTPDSPPGEWWHLYDDARLDGFVAQALEANTDLRVAAANLSRARAALRETRTSGLPSTTVSTGGSYGRQSGAAQGLDTSLPDGEMYDAGLDVGYQIDLFGRVRRAVEASRADVESVQAAYDLTRISVVAETVRAYADARNTACRIAVARRSVEVQEQTFDLTRRLLEGGRVTAMETNQAGALLEQTRAEIPTLEATQQTALYRLAVLTGRPPTDFPRDVDTCVGPLRLNQPIPVGDAATLLNRRPDVRAAERRLAAATARIGVATADLYPSISIGGSIGGSATSLGDITSGSAFRYSIGPLISWSFPNITAARARIAQAEASQQAALAEFDGTWLTALQQTESALTTYARGLDRTAALRRGTEQAREAARIARLRYDAGRENFQIVLDAERQLASAEAALAQSDAQLSTDLIALFLSLGGGWQ